MSGRGFRCGRCREERKDVRADMKMTPNRRIGLNILATYLRSLYTLCLGLVTARWLLLSLGQKDYGLLGVVGGLVAFVTFINTLLAGSVSRFYAVEIGRAQKKGYAEKALMECRRWFSAAVSVHTVVPILLVSIGYPLGEYAVRHWLVVPPDRLAAAIWVWRFSCLSAWVGMANVPFTAMYTAKQEIAEMTLFSVVESTFSALLLYYMVMHPGDWLAAYAGWHCALSVLPKLCICVRAIIVFPECRFRRDCFCVWSDIRKIAVFAGWNAFGMVGSIAKRQGVAILVNRTFGSAQNAAIAIANRLVARMSTFSTSIVSAFYPVITTSWGGGDLKKMNKYVFRVERLAGTVTVIVLLPLLIEVHEVMVLWLKKPPSESPFLCACAMVSMFLNEISIGHAVAIAATGRLAVNRCLYGLFQILALPAVWLLFLYGGGLYSVAYVSMGVSLFVVVLRICEGLRVASIPVGHWICRVLLSVGLVLILALLCGLVPRLLLSPSFFRVCLTAFSVELVLLPMVWLHVLDDEERCYVIEKVKKAWRKVRT